MVGQVASRAQTENLSNGRLTVATDRNRSVSCPDCKSDSPRHSPEFVVCWLAKRAGDVTCVRTPTPGTSAPTLQHPASRAPSTQTTTPPHHRDDRESLSSVPNWRVLNCRQASPPGACQGSAATATNVARLPSIFRGKPWAGCLTPPTVLPQRNQQ